MFKSYTQLPQAVYTLCIGTLINRAGTMLYPFLTLYLTRKLDWSTADATWAVSAFGMGAIGAMLIGGHLADVVGRRFVMLVALFGGAASLVVLVFLESAWAVIACLVAFAFLAEMYRPAASAMIADLVEPERRAHAYSLNYLAINLGFTIAPLIGGYIIARGSFSWLFIVDAVTTGCFAFIVLLMIKETLVKEKPARETNGGSLPEAQDNRSFSSALKIITADRVFMVYALATFCIAMVYMQAMSTLPLYLDSKGFGADQYGLILMVNGLMIVLIQIPLTGQIAKWHRGTTITLAAAVTAIGFGLTATAVTMWHFAATVLVWTLGEMMSAPTAPAIAADLAPKELRARYMGVFSVSFSAGNVVGVPLGGWVLSTLGGEALWSAAFGMGVVATLLFLSLRREMAPPEDRTPSGATE